MSGAIEALLQKEKFLLVRTLTYAIFQILNGFEEWSLEYVAAARNRVAVSIANSVTSGHRYQSYLRQVVLSGLILFREAASYDGA